MKSSEVPQFTAAMPAKSKASWAPWAPEKGEKLQGLFRSYRQNTFMDGIQTK